jgi:ABC-type Fe3+-hydroxamate transport system substrate-binding protein
MNRRRSFDLAARACWLLFLAWSSGAHADIETKAASRIAALAPSLTELVYAAGAGDSLIAVSAFSDFPEAAKKLPQVSDFAGINIEALLVLKPDLVLVWDSGTRPADIARLKQFGIRTESIRVATLEDVPMALRRIGALAGTASVADRAAVTFSTRIEALKKANLGKPRLTVFFEIGQSPLMTINSDHVISEVIALCGGANVFSDAPSLVFQPSREELIKRDPQVILRAESLTGSHALKGGIYDGLTAYGRGWLLPVSADDILRPGPRLANAVGQVCQGFDRLRAQGP